MSKKGPKTPNFQSHISSFLKSFMQAENMTQRDFAERIGMSPTQLNAILLGTKNCSWNTSARIAQELGLSLKALVPKSHHSILEGSQTESQPQNLPFNYWTRTILDTIAVGRVDSKGEVTERQPAEYDWTDYFLPENKKELPRHHFFKGEKPYPDYISVRVYRSGDNLRTGSRVIVSFGENKKKYVRRVLVQGDAITFINQDAIDLDAATFERGSEDYLISAVIFRGITIFDPSDDSFFDGL